MTVVKENEIEQKEKKNNFYNLDEYLSLAKDERYTYTGQIFQSRIVLCKWFNSQAKLEKAVFKPEMIIRENANSKSCNTSSKAPKMEADFVDGFYFVPDWDFDAIQEDLMLSLDDLETLENDILF